MLQLLLSALMAPTESVDLVQVESKLKEVVSYHKVNIKLGAACSLLSISLLFCLLTKRAFRQNNKLIICLALADFVNCIGICLMGLDRVSLYNSVLLSGSAEQETSWSCALEFWLLVRTIGDLWPPIVQLFMGLDQYLNVCQNKKNKKRQKSLAIISISFVIVFTTVAYIQSFLSRNKGPVKYHCGRKAAFGRIISGLIYSHNVTGYVSGVVLNSIAVHQLKKENYDDKVLEKRKEEQLQYTKSCFIVSCISTILVSIPNCISLCSLLITSVRDSISKPAVWATCLNSGVNIFIYFFANDEFRSHVVCTIPRKNDASEKEAKVNPNSFLHINYKSMNVSRESSSCLSI